MRTQVLFFFDTEDFTSNHAADAIRKLAEICTSEGVRAHFALVGLLAMQLRRWGREDVIRALEPHIIGTHTYGHSVHPNICEQTDYVDFDRAYAEVTRWEAQGIGMIRGALGRDDIRFAVPPGNAKSYAAMYAYADMGIPFYCDTVVTDARQSELSCCNMRQIAYTYGLEGIVYGDTPNWEVLLDDWASHERVILFTHPNSAYFSEFWDGVNYRGENPEFGCWKPCRERTAEESARYFDTFHEEIRRLKADDRFEITHLDALDSPRNLKVFPHELPTILDTLRVDFAPVGRLSLADVFLAAHAFLNGKTEYTQGLVYGFLSAPQGIDAPCTVARSAVIEAARRLDVSRFLPETIAVNGKILGAADFLFAMLSVLTSDDSTINLVPRPQQPSLEEYPSLKRFAPAGQWIHPASFCDHFISDRLRLQAWTIRRGY